MRLLLAHCRIRTLITPNKSVRVAVIECALALLLHDVVLHLRGLLPCLGVIVPAPRRHLIRLVLLTARLILLILVQFAYDCGHFALHSCSSLCVESGVMLLIELLRLDLLLCSVVDAKDRRLLLIKYVSNRCLVIVVGRHGLIRIVTSVVDTQFSRFHSAKWLNTQRLRHVCADVVSDLNS